MHDPLTSTALRQLGDINREPDPPQWAWSVARLDAKGRIPLPSAARRGLGDSTVVHGWCHRVGLVLSVEGAGVPMPLDARGRLHVPAVLRGGADPSMVIGARLGGDPLVVVAPAASLDGLGDLLAGPFR